MSPSTSWFAVSAGERTLTNGTWESEEAPRAPARRPASIVHDDVELHVTKGAVARRIRWDVLRTRP